MMGVGYFYNLTFVQFGLLDLGTQVVGMSRAEVSRGMAILALTTCLIAIVFGLLMQYLGWSQRFRTKLRLALGVVLVQAVLTSIAPSLRNSEVFLAWILVASLALGVGVPVTFSLTVDLVPVKWRGYAGGLITVAAYFPAALFSTTWTVEEFSLPLTLLMLAGAGALAVLSFARHPWVDQLAGQHRLPQYGRGRFLQPDKKGGLRLQRSLVLLIVLMFGIYFIDSLGFLRLSETPVYFNTAWKSPLFGTHLTLAWFHVLGAFIGGILYTYLDEKPLFLWIFGIFALVHLMYSFHARLTPDRPDTLASPILYVLAVSLYTVVNFALWADLSTPRTISRNAAIGVALSGWTSTFLSTSLALRMAASGVTLEQHLRIVDALAMLFFLLVVTIGLFMPRSRPGASPLLNQDQSLL